MLPQTSTLANALCPDGRRYKHAALGYSLQTSRAFRLAAVAAYGVLRDHANKDMPSTRQKKASFAKVFHIHYFSRSHNQHHLNTRFIHTATAS